MGNARKYLALALAACKTKQYEEAGVLFVQATQEIDCDELIKELGVDVAHTSKSTEDIEQNNDDTEVVAESPETDSEVDEAGDEWGDDEEETDGESVSSEPRRKFTTVDHIGKILAASMSAAEDDFSENDDDFSESEEPDPDFEGETLVPASFSSVKVKSLAVESPIKVKA